MNNRKYKENVFAKDNLIFKNYYVRRGITFTSYKVILEMFVYLALRLANQNAVGVLTTWRWLMNILIKGSYLTPFK